MARRKKSYRQENKLQKRGGSSGGGGGGAAIQTTTGIAPKGRASVSKDELASANLSEADLKTGLTAAQAKRIEQLRNGYSSIEEFRKSAPVDRETIYYAGEKVRGYIKANGEVFWTVNDKTIKQEGNKIPFSEIKALNKAFDQYLKTNQGKRFLFAQAEYRDQSMESRTKAYIKRGFKENSLDALTYDNRTSAARKKNPIDEELFTIPEPTL